MKHNEVERIFRDKSPQLPNLLTQHYRAQLSAVGTAAGTLLITAPHGMRWLTLDPKGSRGCRAEISLDGPLTSTHQVSSISPGRWCDITGRNVWVRMTANGQALENATTEYCTFIACADPTPPTINRDPIDTWTVLDVVPAVTTVPTLSTEGVAIGAANTVTVHMHDNVTGTRIVTTETADIEVWWRLQNGIWAHNDSDDFDAGGRGAATYTAGGTNHDVETFVVPHNATRIYLNKTSGSVLWADLIFSVEL